MGYILQPLLAESIFGPDVQRLPLWAFSAVESWPMAKTREDMDQVDATLRQEVPGWTRTTGDFVRLFPIGNGHVYLQTTDSIPTFEERQQQPDPQSIIERLRDGFPRLLDGQMRGLHTQVERAENQVDRLRSALTETLRTAERLRAQLDVGLREDLVDSTLRDLKALLENGTLSTVALKDARDRDSVLAVETGAIECQRDSDGALFDLGRVRIEIDFITARVSFSSLDRKHPSLTHPHVRGGRACFGNADEAIAELCARYEIVPLLNLLLSFLRSANASDSWGRSIAQWPKVAEGDGTRLEHPRPEVDPRDVNDEEHEEEEDEDEEDDEED